MIGVTEHQAAVERVAVIFVSSGLKAVGIGVTPGVAECRGGGREDDGVGRVRPRAARQRRGYRHIAELSRVECRLQPAGFEQDGSEPSRIIAARGGHGLPPRVAIAKQIEQHVARRERIGRHQRGRQSEQDGANLAIVELTTIN